MPPVPLREENSEAKGKDKRSIHFNGSEENIELLLRTVISANQLSVYGAVADLCRERPSLGHKSCHHQDRYSIEIVVESLFQDRTAVGFES